jgi:hypothetical protein
VEDAIVAMLNALSGAAAGNTDDLLLSPEQYNSSLYQAAITIHNTAVKPITAIVLSIMFVIMLASSSTRVEGDRELGVRIIAATMFKCALVLVVAQNAVLILTAIKQHRHPIAVPPTRRPWAVQPEPVARSATRCAMTSRTPAWSSSLAFVITADPVHRRRDRRHARHRPRVRPVPPALHAVGVRQPATGVLRHEDTKQIGVGYLKRYATTAPGRHAHHRCQLYQALLGGWLGNNVHYDGNTDMWNFVISNFGSFLVAPAVLIFLLFGSNSLAKAIVGEG